MSGRDLYRSLVADRRLLVVLDNARSTRQVRMLLPGSSTCGAMLTSRRRLPALTAHGAVMTMPLGVLRASESAALIRSVAGARRLSGAAVDVARLGGLCGHLPLAVRVAAARLAAEPMLPVSAMVAELSDRMHVLERLSVENGEISVTAAFETSYAALDADRARAFRLCSAHPGQEFGLAAAAALLDAQPDQAREWLRELSSNHLIQVTGEGRYSYHDLVRVFAARCAARYEPATEVAAARHRALRWYLAAVARASGLIAPNHQLLLPPAPPVPVALHDRDQAFAWLERERTNLMHALSAAVTSNLHEIAWKLAHQLTPFLRLRGHRADLVSTASIGLDAARHLGDRDAEAALLVCRAAADFDYGDFVNGLALQQQALAIRRETGDRHGEAVVLQNIGACYGWLADWDRAVRHLAAALDLGAQLGDPPALAIAHNNLGEAHLQRAEYAEAEAEFQRARSSYRQMGDVQGEAWAVHNIGMLWQAVGELDRAHDALHSALMLRASTLRETCHAKRFQFPVHHLPLCRPAAATPRKAGPFPGRCSRCPRRSRPGPRRNRRTRPTAGWRRA